MVEMRSDLKRTKNGEPLPGTLALGDRIEQMLSQAELLTRQAELLATLEAELPPDLSIDAQKALALLVTGGNK
jgi:hypothetical protein